MKPALFILAIIACLSVRGYAQSPQNDPMILQLMRDNVVNETKGFVIEKKQNKLFINGQLQSEAIAQKYLPLTQQATIHYQVFPLQDRIRMHPNTSLIQVLMPVSLESPCVDKGKKSGC